MAGPGRDNDGMLRAALLMIRLAAFVFVGITAFGGAWPGAVDRAAEIAAFSVTGLLGALWALTWRSRPASERFDSIEPYVLGAIAVVCGAAAALPRAGNFDILALLAVATASSGASLRTGWIMAALGTAAIEAVGLARGDSAWVTVEYPAGLLLGLILGATRRAYRVQAEQAAALAAQSEQLREEQARAAALEERTRIAREIHDVLAHSLGALGVHVELAHAVLTEARDEIRAAELLEQARRMAADGLAETRRAVHVLRGETPPLPEGLARINADHQLRHRAAVTFQVTGEPRALPPDAGLALTRTAQEALVNAAKHAPHQPITVCLAYEEAAVSLTVTSRLSDGSDGSPGSGDELDEHDLHGRVGEAQDPPMATVDGGYGLTGMRERLLLLNGTLRAGRSGGDWVVEARVPR